MKSHLKHLVDGTDGSVNQRISIAREYLQARILQSFQEDGVFARWAFQGGTALRFLFSIPRFSEDLDFASIRAGEDVGFERALRRTQSAFREEGYDIVVKSKTEKTVASAFVGFEGLLYELGLSPQRRKIFSVKVEVDTNPPAGATLETTLVRRHVVLNLHHYDRASLLSGKLHAILSRPWCKAVTSTILLGIWQTEPGLNPTSLFSTRRSAKPDGRVPSLWRKIGGPVLETRGDWARRPMFALSAPAR